VNGAVTSTSSMRLALIRAGVAPALGPFTNFRNRKMV